MHIFITVIFKICVNVPDCDIQGKVMCCSLR